MSKKGRDKQQNDFSSLITEIKSLKQEILSLKGTVVPKKQVKIPLEVFSKSLSSLETTVKYLKENKLLQIKQIALMLNRSDKTISQAYVGSKKKSSSKLKLQYSEFSFPVDILANRKLSILENIVVYLKAEYALGFSAIGRLLRRNHKTIWTTYQRALKKGVKSND